MDPYIGKMLDGRYEILERIGTGGMSIVYKAKCHRLNRLVAIKILKSDLAQNEDFRRRFNAESQAVAQLSNANIVSVYDVSRGGDTEYIVMELIDGITLKQYMERRGQLNWRESLHFIMQIMRGLSHAHSRGIIHRDIKPQNVMVLRDGSVKVADFGIACLEDSAQTITQQALGSVHYISPEQAKGEKPDARSDIYSSGVVFYEMLTGRLPFEGDSAVAVAIQHLSAIPLAPREINPEIPEQLELICMKAMAPDINKRYASADEMIADLEAFRKDPNVVMQFDLTDLKSDVVDEPTRPVRRAAAGGHAEGERGRALDARDTESAQERRRMLLIGAAAVAAIAVVALLFKTIFGSFGTSAVDQYQVPSVLGMTVEEAQEAEQVRDIFTIQEMGSVFSTEYPEGAIAEQNPAAHETRKGSQLVIEVWTSLGEERGEMVSVTGMTAAQARIKLDQLIEKYHLTIVDEESNYRFSDEVAENCVIETIPAAGEEVKDGDRVILVMSKGPEIKLVPVPQFVGQAIDAVRAQLETFNLVCTDADVTLEQSEKPEGTILWQSLEASSQVEEGSTIQFRVSSGLKIEEMRVTFSLPEIEETTVLVEVYVGSESMPQYSETVRLSDGTVSPILRGAGKQMVRVYFNGAYSASQSHEVQFN